MKKTILVALFILFFASGAGLLWEFSNGITGRAILDDYSYTRAFCEGLYCEDYEVFCNGNEFVKMVLVENSGILHEEGWVDFRKDEKLC